MATQGTAVSGTLVLASLFSPGGCCLLLLEISEMFIGILLLGFSQPWHHSFGLCVANLGIHLINVTYTQKNLVLFSSTYTVNIKSPFLVLALTVTLEVNSVQLKKTHTLEALVYLLWFSQHL